MFLFLVMMPLLMFIFAPFYLDLKKVKVPYTHIVIQMLQITIPAVFGLILRWYKPNWANKTIKYTKPTFLFFIVFFLTVGIYVNKSIIYLMIAYPIVIPTAALLPWVGFVLSSTVAFIFRQPKKRIITIALETGIQNVGIPILILMYSMSQPEGDLGAVMPITVALLTPIPLYIIYLYKIIKRKCKKGIIVKADFQEIECLTNKTDKNEITGINDKIKT